MNVFFTIIIPALNEEKYLPKLLGDLANQDFRNFEVILVDGRSEDATVKNAEGFAGRLPKLTILVSDKRNVSYQRNLGASKANGSWLIFMDADNRLPSYFLQGIKYKADLFGPDGFTCFSKVDSKKAADKLIPAFHNLGLDIGMLIENPTAYGALIGIRKAVFNKLGGFSPNVKYAEDSDLIVRLHKKGYKFKVFHDPKYVYSLRRYRRSGTLKTLRKTVELHLKNFVKLPINQEKEYPMGGVVAKRNKKG
jgi:glycosyltransferase involved in cell wall biosynthesis